MREYMISKQRKGKRQARFWISTMDGDVRVKINAGVTITYNKWMRTDEGWHSESATFAFDGYEVSRRLKHEGCDCDRRVSYSGKGSFKYRDYAGGRAVRFCDKAGKTFPEWR
jgi:hypothetical protein